MKDIIASFLILIVSVIHYMYCVFNCDESLLKVLIIILIIGLFFINRCVYYIISSIESDIEAEEQGGHAYN